MRMLKMFWVISAMIILATAAQAASNLKTSILMNSSGSAILNLDTATFLGVCQGLVSTANVNVSSINKVYYIKPSNGTELQAKIGSNTHIFVAPGQYSIGATTVTNKHNLTIEMSPGAVILSTNANGMLNFINCTNIKLIGGQYKATQANTQYLILVQENIKDFEIRDASFDGSNLLRWAVRYHTALSGATTRNMTNLKIIHNDFKQVSAPTTTDSAAINILVDESNSHLKDIQVINNRFADLQQGVNVQLNRNSSTINNLKVNDNEFSNLHKNGTTQEVHAVLLTVNNAQTKVSNGYKGVQVIGNSVNGVYHEGDSQTGTSLATGHEAIYFKSSNTLVANNVIIDGGKYPICVKGSVTNQSNVEVTSNQIINLRQSYNVSDGILLDYNGDAKISNNFIYNYFKGIEVGGTNPKVYAILSENTIKNCTYAYTIGTTSTNVYLNDNTLINTPTKYFTSTQATETTSLYAVNQSNYWDGYNTPYNIVNMRYVNMTNLTIDQNANAASLVIDTEATTQHGISVNIANSAAIFNCGSLSSSAATCQVTRDVASAISAGPVMRILQDNTGDDQVALLVRQDANINALQITSSATGQRAISIDDIPSNKAIDMADGDAICWGAGNCYQFISNAGTNIAGKANFSSKAGLVVAKNLSGTGAAFVCVDANGILYRSGTACA